MLNAAEAKALYDDSGVEVAKYLQYKIEPEIKAAATSGKHRLFHFVGSRDVFTQPRPDPLQTRIIEKLREFGYTVQWVEAEGESYGPRGLADDNNNHGPSCVYYGIVITW